MNHATQTSTAASPSSLQPCVVFDNSVPLPNYIAELHAAWLAGRALQ